MTRPGDRGAPRLGHRGLNRRRAGCAMRVRRKKGSTRGEAEPGRAIVKVTKGPDDSAKRPRDRMVRNAG